MIYHAKHRKHGLETMLVRMEHPLCWFEKILVGIGTGLFIGTVMVIGMI